MTLFILSIEESAVRNRRGHISRNEVTFFRFSWNLESKRSWRTDRRSWGSKIKVGRRNGKKRFRIWSPRWWEKCGWRRRRRCWKDKHSFLFVAVTIRSVNVWRILSERIGHLLQNIQRTEKERKKGIEFAVTVKNESLCVCVCENGGAHFATLRTNRFRDCGVLTRGVYLMEVLFERIIFVPIFYTIPIWHFIIHLIVFVFNIFLVILVCFVFNCLNVCVIHKSLLYGIWCSNKYSV